MENVAPTGGTTMPAQIAMNGQSLPQSGFCCGSGQQGMQLDSGAASTAKIAWEVRVDVEWEIATQGASNFS